jgi:hypothetical protein
MGQDSLPNPGWIKPVGKLDRKGMEKNPFKPLGGKFFGFPMF